MIGQTISHYKILEKLGEGGMGVVYKAEDLTLDRHVALKFLSKELSVDESAKKRFIHEAKAASALEHPNICSVYEIDQAPDGRLFMVMPCYEGNTLRERINRGPLDIDEALGIAAQVASALAKAHEKGIVHRDVKPGNVMLTEGGRQVKLMDFGLVKKLDATKVTRTGMTVGTIAYMSPEQALGKEIDPRTDVWSLGVILYEMLTGRLPFRGAVEPALIYSIVNEEPEAVSAFRRDVPVEIENLIDKAVTKNVEERYETVEKFLIALDEQREKLKYGVRGRGLLTMRRKARQRLLRISIPALLVVAAIVILVIFQPFEIEIRPKTKEAIARENSIVVLPFENLMDPTDADVDAYAITSLLTTGLRESEYMQVVSEGRVNDVLKQLGEENQRKVSREVAEEVARRTSSSWILMGKLYQVVPNLVVTAEISNAVTGEVRGKPANVRGEEGETVLEIVDKLKAKIGEELALPPEAMEKLDRSIAEVTTSSPEAYRHYLEGVRKGNKLHWEDAIVRYEKALEYDSTFAMAYLRMTHMMWLRCQQLGKCQLEKVRWCLQKARENSGKLTGIQKIEMEGLEAMVQGDYLRAKNAMLEIVEQDPQEKRIWNFVGDITRVWLGEHEEAIGYYEKVVELDSTFASGLAYGWISLSSNVLGDSETAEWAARKYVTLAPEDVQANWVYAQFLIFQGRIEEAIEYLEKCEKINPGSEIGSLVQAYINARRYQQADSIYRQLIASSNMVDRQSSRRNLACISMAQGKLDQALGILEDGMAADRLEKQTDPWKHHLKARILLHKNRTDLAIQELETANEFTKNHRWSYAFYISFLSLGERVTEAEDSLRIFRTRVNEADYMSLGLYQWSRGMVELANENPESAFVYLQKSVENVHKRMFFHDLPMRFSLAKAYLDSERPADAAKIIESALQLKYTYDVAHSILLAKAHHLAGLIYEQLGDGEKAVAQYEEFLELWEEADSDLVEVPDARQRLALLKE